MVTTSSCNRLVHFPCGIVVYLRDLAKVLEGLLMIVVSFKKLKVANDVYQVTKKEGLFTDGTAINLASQM
jgi:hypothetical protein